MGSYWPYATTIWDYINRAMPFKNPGMLSHDQVYAVTAYVLFLNGIIPENAVVVPGARTVRDDWGRAEGLALQTPVIVKYRDEKTDAATALESWLR